MLKKLVALQASLLLGLLLPVFVQAQTTTRVGLAGKIASISGATLMVKGASGRTYNVDASKARVVSGSGATTQRMFILPNDSVQVAGTVSTTPVISATTVKDLSLRGPSTLTGTVTAVSGSTFTLRTSKGSVPINTTSSTIFRRGNASARLSNIRTGSRVTITAIWNTTADKVTATRVNLT